MAAPTDPTPSPFAGGLPGFFGRLRFPQLLILFAVLFGVDLAIPDLIPFIDEIFLALMTALFASLKRPGGAAPEEPSPGGGPPMKNVTPRR
jgi:Family of unknown function (DUF6116)